MENVIIIGVILLIVSLAAGYVIRAKKQGQKCIGCPAAKTCSGNCSGCSKDCSCK